MSGLMHITSKSELQVLCHLWKYSTYNESDKGNCVLINTKVISDINKETDLSEQTIRNTICKLANKETHLLIKDKNHRATYYLNPKYFFKGALKDRAKVMKVVLSYIEK